MVRVSPAQPAVLLHERLVGSFDIKTIRLRHIWRKDGMTVKLMLYERQSDGHTK